ncbi:hypothetical protein [Psychrobacillus psychrodurans]|uniref:Uncharacterized protein n=1 Tax=Psychrobacillus psychrodurans TaxID=126157 RepID=A0A9X3RAL7_9BACI|nr:hypothetical protein [Psychrobacillus psychrodurans]MCZ8534211.1 hypothetical protein [Psychrobacillus psychrodurans]
MLAFNETIKIFQSYSELEEKISGNRHQFQLPQSLQRGKELAREIKCNQDGSYNGYIHARYMSVKTRQKYAHVTDSREMINIKGLTALQLNEAIQDGIQSMTCKKEDAVGIASLKTNQEEIHYAPFTKIQTQTDSPIEKLVHSCLYNWLGYGNPNGQVWFIGTEEGGAEIWRQQTKTLKESLSIRSDFNLHMDFLDVWENQYDISLSTFSGANVWNFMAAFLLNFNGQEANSNTIKDFVFNNKLLGRADGKHYLCELFPLPKKTKNSIEPYEKIWSSVKNYHDEVLEKRFELIKNTIIDNPRVQIIFSYEKGLVELIKQNLSSSLEQISIWKYGNQQYSLFQLKLGVGRTVLLLSTPFFGQGQISYEGIKDCVRHLNSYIKVSLC